jgi:hypothetical protein
MVAGRDAAWVADITRNDPGSTLIFDGMAVVWASVIAVLGTLGGATASYLFQGKTSERNESKARDERLRQERLTAYSSFAGAVMDLRGIQYHRGYSRMTVEDQHLDRSSIRAESSQLRSVAWTAFYRFKLTSPDQQLTNLATRAVKEAVDVADASDKVDLKKRSERARARIDEFIGAAATYLEAGSASPVLSQTTGLIAPFLDDD